jgi:hypothetical protein
MVNDDYLMTCMLKGLLNEKNYALTVSTIFKKEYFDDAHMAEIFDTCRKHLKEFNTLPNKDIIINSVSNDVKDKVIKQFKESEATDFNISQNYDWLLEETNKFLKDRAIKNAIVKSVDLIDANQDVQQIRNLIEDALCKDIKIDLGLDYFENLSERLKRIFTASDNRIKTFYPTLDELFNGGFPSYTLNFFLAKIHGHKCVCKDTVITIRNNTTKEIKDVKISDLYKNIDYNQCIEKENDMTKLKLFQNKYGEEEGKKKYDEYISKQKLSQSVKGRKTLEWYINKYGEKEGKKRYDKKILNITKGTKGINTLEWYTNKYGEEKGKKKYDEKNLKISDKGRTSLEWYTNKYDEEEGKKKYDEYISKQRFSQSLKGYIHKHGKEKGTLLWTKRCEDIRKRNTLQGYVNKYGEEEGKKRFDERQKKWQNTLNSKSLKEIERINRAKICNVINSNGYSKISQKLFWVLYNEIKDFFNEIYFATLNSNKIIDNSGFNHEKFLMLNDRNVFPDFFIKDVNKIIEFDGDYWHNEARGNIKRDNERDESLINAGYEVLHIKENLFKNDCDYVIKKCLRFIYDE